MELTRTLSKISISDVQLAGGKGASLGEMKRVGIPIPSGFVVLSEAFKEFITKTDLTIEIGAILSRVNHKEIHTVEHASEEIMALILKEQIPIDIASIIENEYKKLGASYVAIRSSATAEDSLSAAWAGQLESYLNITEENLLENVKKCWASLFTSRAIFYRFQNGLDKTNILVAVVIQKMVDAEISGIAFSVHPVTQDPNQIIIEAGYGLGEAVVSGQITPDSYVIEKGTRKIIDINIFQQEQGLYRSPMGGNEWKNISKEKKSLQKIPEEKILELYNIILAIEDHYGFPCDIEWAYEDGKFYILQSRPITTLSKK